ncbi:MAG: hypothetical protein J5951_03255 [Bacteroidales bacterium]|nr:hypothetical protein [Bacteroidales bacterium]
MMFRFYPIILTAALLLLGSSQALAQTVPDWKPGQLVRKGTCIAVDTVKLDKAATLRLLEGAGGPQLSDDWQRYCSQRGWGIGLTAGGFTVAAAGVLYSTAMVVGGAVGSALVAVGGDEAVQGVWNGMSPRINGGMIVAGVGAVAGITGVVLLINGNTHLRHIVRDCNEPGASSVTLTLGPTPSGVGLALRF